MSNINVRLAGMRVRKTEEAGYVPGGYLIEPDKTDNLPPGVTQVEYLEMIAPKLYMLDFKGDDLPRIQKLLSEHDPDLTSRIVPLRTTVSIKEFRLIIPEALLGVLTKKEQDRAELFVPPTQIQYRVPVLYRFIKRRYAEELIKDGKLRISSFERCRKCEGGCGERFDQGEGKGGFSIQAGDITGEFMLQVGGNPLMLCMALSPDARRSKGDVCIEIFDLFALIAAISAGLAEKGITIKRIMHGPCSYADRLFVRRCVKSGHDLEKLLGQLTSGTGSFDFNLCGKIAFNEVGEQHYFTKPMKFADEHEYRIVWDCDCIPGDGKVDIVLKNVQSFCRLYEDPWTKVKQRRTESGIECAKRKKMRSSRRIQG